MHFSKNKKVFYFVGFLSIGLKKQKRKKRGSWLALVHSSALQPLLHIQHPQIMIILVTSTVAVLVGNLFTKKSTIVIICSLGR